MAFILTVVTIALGIVLGLWVNKRFMGGGAAG